MEEKGKLTSCCDEEISSECSGFFDKMKETCSNDIEGCNNMIGVLEQCFCCYSECC